MNRGRFAFLGVEMIEADQGSERPAETIARAFLRQPRPADLNDPTTWSPWFRAAVERARDERIAELHDVPGVASIGPDPSDPRGIVIVYEEPVRVFEIRLDRAGDPRPEPPVVP